MPAKPESASSKPFDLGRVRNVALPALQHSDLAEEFLAGFGTRQLPKKRPSGTIRTIRNATIQKDFAKSSRLIAFVFPHQPGPRFPVIASGTGRHRNDSCPANRFPNG